MNSLLAEAVKRDACPLRRSFFERPAGSDSLTPLASLLRTQGEHGGKGAALRVSLLLSIIWLCAREPYTTSRVAGYWAELLDRDDPRGEGARAVRDCLHELAERGFIRLSTSGSRIVIAPLMEDRATDIAGQPAPYEPPYSGGSYVTVPRAFWTEGLAGTLSGAGLAMYLVALAMTRHDDPEFYLSGAFFDERFGISRSSRKRGLAELVSRGVLDVRVQQEPDLTTFRIMRRNIYTVTPAYLQLPPRENPTPTTEPKSPEGTTAVIKRSKRGESAAVEPEELRTPRRRRRQSS